MSSEAKKTQDRAQELKGLESKIQVLEAENRSLRQEVAMRGEQIVALDREIRTVTKQAMGAG